MSHMRGNPHASRAEEREFESALIEAILAVAHELRTATLAQIELHGSGDLSRSLLRRLGRK